jgi:thioredoxin 1
MQGLSGSIGDHRKTVMAAIELNSRKEFDHTIPHGVAIAYFNAHWCRPCRAQDPIIDALTLTYKGKATVARVNIDKNQIIAMDLGIQSIPTIIIFKEGREIDRFIGCQAAKTLETALENALK